jgi:hypothetical protein
MKSAGINQYIDGRTKVKFIFYNFLLNDHLCLIALLTNHKKVVTFYGLVEYNNQLGFIFTIDCLFI